MHSIFWFRRDLRLDDNTALYHALSSDQRVVPIFIFDTDILKHLEDHNDARVTFIHKALENIHTELSSAGSSLRVFVGKPIDVFKTLLESGEIDSIYCNGDYEPYGVSRDLEVQKLCSQNGVIFKSYKDQVIFEKVEVIKNDHTPYTVFTPYKNKWLENFKTANRKQWNSRSLLKNIAKGKSKFPSLKDIGFGRSSIEIPEPTLSPSQLKNYAKLRNVPSLPATTKVGVHLRFGTISVRECVKLAIKYSDTWLRQLIWREFFMQILFNFPNVVSEPAKIKYSQIKWRNNKEEFEKWCEGRTGVALVDAGMRELNSTGFMHNRVRMVAASFLVKNLLIDYRWGERYFARKLLDFELASNNGNWQWVAGTGCDAAPYFRVFNPDTQLKKFDPTGEYVRKWVPEYESLNYPQKIVDLDDSRKRAVAAYQASATRN